MSGVFLSYSRGDRALAAQVAAGLRNLGVEVWWDEDMPGVDWQLELERQINELAAVLVLWTPLSISSKNVRDEARLGQQIDKLVNGLAGVDAPPFPFDRINGLPLDGLTGRAPHSGWVRLVQTVEEHLVRAGSAKPGEVTGALARHDQAVRAKQAAVADAELAYQRAKSDEDAVISADEAAATTLSTAEEQLTQVVAMRGSATILRAARADVEAAQVAKHEAAAARKAADAALATASRQLAGARTDFERLFQTESAPPPAPLSVGRASAGEPTPGPLAALPPTVASHEGSRPPAPGDLERRGRQVPWLVVGVAAALVAAAGGWWLLSRAPASATAAGSGSPPTVALAAAQAMAGHSLAVSEPDGLTGEWSGNGATCANPLAIIVSGTAISVVLDGAAQKATIQSISGGVASVAWPDGAWTYKVAGDTLTMTPAGGQPMAYQRCAG